MATLRYATQAVPYGPLAAAVARGVEVTAEADAKLPRDTPPVLTLPSGCAPPEGAVHVPQRANVSAA